MTTKKLIPMHDFVLEIDALTTLEFCNMYGCPVPKFIGNVETSADQFLQVDAIKHRIFVEYAKFLNKPLNEQMFSTDEKKEPLFLIADIEEIDKGNAKIAYLFPNALYTNIGGQIFLKSVMHKYKIADLVSKELCYNSNHNLAQHFSH